MDKIGRTIRGTYSSGGGENPSIRKGMSWQTFEEKEKKPTKGGGGKEIGSPARKKGAGL